MEAIQHVLEFWFYEPSHKLYGEKRVEWFNKDSKFDEKVTRLFFFDFEKAKNGDYLNWTNTKEGCLALIVVFDQFSRHMFRDSGTSFSTDGKARAVARHMLETGFFDDLEVFQKNFAALPFEHSEDLEDQKLSVKLYKSFSDEESIQYAVRHHDIIQKFGRFPHRNNLLGRQSTQDEIDFLKQPNSSF